MIHIRPERAFAPPLLANERTLWTGRPPAGLMLRPSDATQIPFSLLWGGFVLFWEASALQRKGSLLMSLWGLPFVLIGLHLMIGRFFLDAFRRRHTYYVLTNRRALIVSGIGQRAVRSVLLFFAQEIELSVRPDGTGTIRFGRQEETRHAGRGRGSAADDRPCFERVPEAQRVYDAILNVIQTNIAKDGPQVQPPASVCVRCGYDLRGQTEPRCPECGHEYDAALLSAPRELPATPEAGSPA